MKNIIAHAETADLTFDPSFDRLNFTKFFGNNVKNLLVRRCSISRSTSSCRACSGAISWPPLGWTSPRATTRSTTPSAPSRPSMSSLRLPSGRRSKDPSHNALKQPERPRTITFLVIDKDQYIPSVVCPCSRWPFQLSNLVSNLVATQCPWAVVRINRDKTAQGRQMLAPYSNSRKIIVLKQFILCLFFGETSQQKTLKFVFNVQ